MLLTRCAFFVAAGLFLGVSAQSNSEDTNSTSLPTVDLGYEIQQATFYNASGNYYNFSNIRYAAPPTGEFRFAAPQSPASNRSAVQTGTPDRICPQANTAWIDIADQFLTLFLAGQTQFNSSSFNSSSPSEAPPPEDPRSTEDCLFLDVVVPKATFDKAGKGYGAPVLVWIFGGGYVTGSKTSWGNPAGLLERSEMNHQDGVIYVSLNYRLGAFGWLSGPTFQQDNGTANAGLLDQRFALEWIQQNIHLFGGDPNRVTVLGESAGGGSIMHQITAYGGNKGSAPFAQAVLQSPAFWPIVSNQQQEQTFTELLSLLNVTTLEDARKLPYSVVQAASVKQIGASSYGQYTYGPVVDGDFVPALPGELLLHGQYTKDLRVMVGHNANEGLLFTSPFVQNDTAFAQLVTTLAPTLNAYPKVLDYIVNTLYPSNFDGSQAMAYTSQVARAAALISELIITCNTFYLDKAFGNNTYSYFYAVPPGLHGLDVPYTYYNDDGQSKSVVDPKIAIALQEYITSFAESGSPNEAGVPYFPTYGSNATVQTLNVTGIMQAADPTANNRCDWWQKVLYA